MKKIFLFAIVEQVVATCCLECWGTMTRSFVEENGNLKMIVKERLLKVAKYLRISLNC